MTLNTEICLIFHAYQPPYPAQDPKIVDRIVRNCYDPFFQSLLAKEKRITLNINGILLKTLESDSPHTIERMQECADEGLIEFLGSGAYHPIFPLLNSKENRSDHIQTNFEISRGIFGNSYEPCGFFPPELAISNLLIREIADIGFRYVLVPQNSIPVLHRDLLPYMKSKLSSSKITLLPRNRDLSNRIAFRHFGDEISFLLAGLDQIREVLEAPPIIAMDIETFGEHHTDYMDFLFRVLDKCTNLTGSELVDMMPDYEVTTIKSSSWSTSDQDLAINPFPLWADPKNAIHSLLGIHFALLDSAEQLLINDYQPEKENAEKFRSKRLRSQFSCQLWWASGDGRWGPKIVQAGLEMQRDTLRYAVECVEAKTEPNSLRELLNISDQILAMVERAIA
ncbi:MAG: hypothetical protein ACE5OZ_19535 [Candidatus Heimdallarchaeota archaeon]